MVGGGICGTEYAGTPALCHTNFKRLWHFYRLVQIFASLKRIIGRDAPLFLVEGNMSAGGGTSACAGGGGVNELK